MKFATSISYRIYRIIAVRKRESKRATLYLNKLLAQFDGSLQPATYKKIITSYSIYIPMICDVFASLRGKKTSDAEKERFILYFICSSLFDDFCDQKQLTHEQLYQISFASDKYAAKNVEEKLFLHAHLALAHIVRDTSYYSEVTDKLFRSQVDSDQQFDPSISNEELKRITQEKGGYAVLLCHFYMEDDISETEKNCWFLIGGIIQLTNDLFDIYKDLQEHSQTLPNRMSDAHSFQQYFSQQVASLEKEISQLPFSRERKLDFLIGMMAICSFGNMALHQLKKLQHENGLFPDLNSLPRKSLIIDMEKPGNIFYCFRYTYQQTLQWWEKSRGI
ncbi:class 1 isoprenoid biosynthesis enzyme [Chitinophaga arvensicola]|uniref:class 1 isoprenoid biosynthesis enzyme n=1 Tax=Chitinophaga arvensicola TaxID=29529 RepID=UPI00115F8FF1|nr:class 1 isoprenoid biosynthesis enzyme [Chitinophaga arvensicola]